MKLPAEHCGIPAWRNTAGSAKIDTLRNLLRNKKQPVNQFRRKLKLKCNKTFINYLMKWFNFRYVYIINEAELSCGY